MGKQNSPKKRMEAGERFALKCREDRKAMRESLMNVRGKKRYTGKESLEPVIVSPSAGKESHQVGRPFRVDRVKCPERKRLIPMIPETPEEGVVYTPITIERPLRVDRVKSPEKKQPILTRTEKRETEATCSPSVTREPFWVDMVKSPKRERPIVREGDGVMYSPSTNDRNAGTLRMDGLRSPEKRIRAENYRSYPRCVTNSELDKALKGVSERVEAAVIAGDVTTDRPMGRIRGLADGPDI